MASATGARVFAADFPSHCSKGAGVSLPVRIVGRVTAVSPDREVCSVMMMNSNFHASSALVHKYLIMIMKRSTAWGPVLDNEFN